MTKTPKRRGGKEQPTPDQNRTHHRKTDITGSVNIRGEIEAKVPADLEKKHDAAETEKNSRDKIRLVVEVLTLVGVIIYAFIAFLQWSATSDAVDAARKANKLLEESTRGRLSLYAKLVPVKVGSIVPG
jgi:hypothetical protein